MWQIFEWFATKDMKSLLRKMNLIMYLNIIYNKLYADVSKETVEHEGPVLKFYLNRLL
jgi:hypothetical protein